MIQTATAIHGIRAKFEFFEDKYQTKLILFVRSFGMMTVDEHDTIRAMSLSIATLLKYDMIFFELITMRKSIFDVICSVAVFAGKRHFILLALFVTVASSCDSRVSLILSLATSSFLRSFGQPKRVNGPCISTEDPARHWQHGPPPQGGT